MTAGSLGGARRSQRELLSGAVLAVTANAILTGRTRDTLRPVVLVMPLCLSSYGFVYLRYKGKRKLTKRGEAEVRRLLYCAAQPARCYQPFEAFYQRQLDKGLPKIAAKVILARKLARIAFSLMNKQQLFIKQATPLA